MKTASVRWSLLIYLLFSFLLSSCSIISGNEISSIENTSWVVDQILNPEGKMMSVLSDTNITAFFRKGQLSGNDGCNQYSASYTINGGQISIIPGVSTMMACPDAVMVQARMYLKNLADSTSYQIDGRKLELRNNLDEVILRYSEQDE